MMSVVTISFLLAAFFPLIAVCAPNQRADRLLSFINAEILSHKSTRLAASSSSNAAIISDQNGLIAPLGSEFPTNTGFTSTSASTGTGSIESSAAGGGTQAEVAASQTPLTSSTGRSGIISAGSNTQTLSSTSKSTYDTSTPGVSSTVSAIQPNQSQEALPAPLGTDHNSGTSAGGGLRAYPSQGSPFSNSTLPIQGDGFGNYSTSGAGTGCPPQQTVSLPPATVTIAQTVTVTASKEVTTITAIPQIQTQTVTITMTSTAGLAPPYPTNAGSSGTGHVEAPSKVPGAGQGTAPTNGSDTGQLISPSNISGPGPGTAPSNGPNIPGLNASTADSVTPATTAMKLQGGETGASPLLNQTGGGPVTPTAKSSLPQFFSIPATLASNLDRVPLASPVPAGTPIVPQYPVSAGGNANTQSGYRLVSSSRQPQYLSVPVAVASNINRIPLVSPVPAGTPIIPQGASSGGPGTNVQSGSSFSPSDVPSGQYPAPYQNATGGWGLPAASGGSIAPGLGPTVSGLVGPTSGPIAPASVSKPLYQINGGIGNASVVSSPTAEGNPLASVHYTKTAPFVNLGPVHPFTGLPAGPSISPLPFENDSTAQASPLSPYSTDAACSINNTITHNITANVS